MILLPIHQWYLESNKVLDFSTFFSSKEGVFNSIYLRNDNDFL